MKFMVNWRLHDDKRIAVLETWAALTPAERADVGDGVKLIGRWHDLAAGVGVLIAETNDIAALHRYLGQWIPVLDLDVVPVLDDEESAAVAKQILADFTA